MSVSPSSNVQNLTQDVYQRDSRKIYATLVRLLGGDFDLAEEMMHEAFAVALRKWEEQVPSNPASWLITTARFKGIDVIRRRDRFKGSAEEIVRKLDEVEEANLRREGLEIEDDRLRLIFTCCHPALAAELQVALTLREVCGLTTEEVADTFLIAHTTMAQRLVRGKNKIKMAKIPYRVPSKEELPERLDAVLAVIYLVFNEGYFSSTGGTVLRPKLTDEAIRLGRLLHTLLPDAEVKGLLALMLLHQSRWAAREIEGELVLLDKQDRSLWDQELIEEGVRLVEEALSSPSVGSYALQAAVSAVHAETPTAAETDWVQILGLYDLLLIANPTPVVELNRAVALSYADGVGPALEVVERLCSDKLSEYSPAFTALAELRLRAGYLDGAIEAFQSALRHTKQEQEKRHLQSRLQSIS